MNTRIAIAVLAAVTSLSTSFAAVPPRLPLCVGQQGAKYVCPMHSEVGSDVAGACPKCGMSLREASSIVTAATAAEPLDSETKSNDVARPRVPIPDTPVYDQRGKKLSFYTDLVKGKTVAINFLFTTCTTICPPLAATFRGVQKELGDRMGRDVSLISISVDPVTDLPERLNVFAAKFNAGPGWTFVTGAKPDIDQLLRALGAYVSNKNDHTPMVLIINDEAGYWTRTYGLAPPWKLADVIKTAEAARHHKSNGKEADRK